MSASKTAEAARKAVEKSERKAGVERTPDQILADIRKNFAAGLAVTPADQKFLLSAYDAAIEIAAAKDITIAELTKGIELSNATITTITSQNEEFRKVYELENRNISLDIETKSVAAFVGDAGSGCGTLSESQE